MTDYSTMVERRVDEVLIGVASCVCTALREAAEEGRSTEVCFCSVMPGAAIAEDYCEEGYCAKKNGMAWTRLVGIQARQEQIEGGGTNDCVTLFDITVEVGVIRAAPVSGKRGEPPTPEEQLAASLQQMSDMGLMLKAIGCCEVMPEAVGEPAIGAYVPLGPEGGCVGGAWSATWTLV